MLNNIMKRLLNIVILVPFLSIMAYEMLLAGVLAGDILDHGKSLLTLVTMMPVAIIFNLASFATGLLACMIIISGDGLWRKVKARDSLFTKDENVFLDFYRPMYVWFRDPLLKGRKIIYWDSF